MSPPRWIERRALLLLHAESLAEHGGLGGIRDEGLLESALARPRNLFAYELEEDPARLAASYAYGITKNHAFHDGNKRAGFQAIGLFLGLNGHRLVADQTNAIRIMLSLASGQVTEAELADWIRGYMKPWN